MLEEVLKAALTKEQWDAGLHLSEPDDHTVLLKNKDDEIIAIFGIHATIENIRKEADKFLICA